MSFSKFSLKVLRAKRINHKGLTPNCKPYDNQDKLNVFLGVFKKRCYSCEPRAIQYTYF